MIKIDKLIKNFGNRNILNIHHLAFEKGVITAVSGENGLGKSTLFNIIAGMDVEYEGEVYRGVPLKETTLLQHPPVMLNRSVESNIAYPLKVRGTDPKKIKARVDELLGIFGIGYIAKKNALSLSSGERQKVALARALSFYPRLLLLDEPASNLDKDSTRLIEGIIRDYSREYGTTTLLISHDALQIERTAHKSINLKDYLIK